MTYYMNPHPALWAPLSQAWERGRGRGLNIVTVYTDMISNLLLRYRTRGWCLLRYVTFRKNSLSLKQDWGMSFVDLCDRTTNLALDSTSVTWVVGDRLFNPFAHRFLFRSTACYYSKGSGHKLYPCQGLKLRSGDCEWG